MMADFAGRGELGGTPPAEHPPAARWSNAGLVTLTAPPGEGWTARVALELRWTDGTREHWTEAVALSAEPLVHALVLPEAIRRPAGDALLVGEVVFEDDAGVPFARVGLGGQPVAVGQGRLAPSTAAAVGVRTGIGLIHDPHDLLDIDGELDAQGRRR